jgi:putative peptide zinc metalloprotease protein
LLSLFFLNHSPILIYFFLFNDLIMFRTMNPFLRMDGYWLVADLFGIYNLREQSTKLIRYYVLKLFGFRAGGQTPLQTLPPRTRVTLAVYSVLSVTFFFYISIIIIRMLVVNLVPTYPTRLLAVWQATQATPFDLLKLLSLIFEVLWRTAVLSGLSIFSYRLVTNVWGMLKVLVQTLLQKLLTLKQQRVEPLSSSRG